jgi:hypothetical protein
VVPPAAPLSDVSDPADGVRNNVTTPLGVTTALEPSFETTGANGQGETEANRLYGTLPPTRVAENRRFTDGGRQFDGRAAVQTDGATLGDIVPLEPTPELNTNEPRR